MRNVSMDKIERIEIIRNYLTFRTGYENRYIDHVTYYKNGAVVAYSDAAERGFLYVVKARRM